MRAHDTHRLSELNEEKKLEQHRERESEGERQRDRTSASTNQKQ